MATNSTPKLTTVNAPKHYSWPAGVETVQLSPATAGIFIDERRHYVYVNGELVGVLKSWTNTPRVRIAGTRLGRDLQPRKVWRGILSGEPETRLNYDTRARALIAMLRDLPATGKD